jgi:hypothetical protein
MACIYCGSADDHYVAACPKVKRVEFYPDGSVKSVEKKDDLPPRPFYPNHSYTSGGATPYTVTYSFNLPDDVDDKEEPH